MLAVCILGIGTVMVQQGFLRSAELMTGASAQLGARVWMQEKMWEAREKLVYSDPPETASEQGNFTDSSNRIYNWSLDVQPAAEGKDLYNISLRVSWREGNRDRVAVQETFATLRSQLQ